jgi:hypothetical protein
MGPYGRILGFLAFFLLFFQVALNCIHKAEWNPFQTHYFSENLVAQGIEPKLSEYTSFPINVSYTTYQSQSL